MLKTYLEREELNTIMDSATTLRDKLIIRFLYHVGCRVSELVQIKVEDIDFERGMALIPHLKSQSGKRPCPSCNKTIGTRQIFCPKCGSHVGDARETEQKRERKRLVKVDRGTLDMAKEYLSRRKRKSDRLISLTRQSIYLIVRSAAADAGFSGKQLLNPDTNQTHFISPHRLRDAHALGWLFAIRERGDDPGRLRELQQHLGHEDFSTTTQYWKLVPAGGELYEEIWGEKSERSSV